MRIKLLYPLIAIENIVSMPYGLGILTAFLRKNEVSIELEDLNARLRGPYYSDLRSSKILREISKAYRFLTNLRHYPGISDRKYDLLP